MLRLILDRSCGCAGFALSRDRDILCELKWEGGSARSPKWFAELSAAIRRSGCRVDEIDEFVCAVGPGSFSGIRSALGALEGMALPCGKPVLGISSAAALACEYMRDAFESVTVIGDARRSRLWSFSCRSDDESGLKLLNGGIPSQSPEDFEFSGQKIKSLPKCNGL
ncbi:MAG: tRNA (adenosine(37)-N6)-threonylcarbamoyltransferase complex dimerization subunit type 1 TsaB [Kiritimatiellia bacterium]